MDCLLNLNINETAPQQKHVLGHIQLDHRTNDINVWKQIKLKQHTKLQTNYAYYSTEPTETKINDVGYWALYLKQFKKVAELFNYNLDGVILSDEVID